MEETDPKHETPADRAKNAADKLRALRARADEALDDHRRRIGAIESELSQRVRQLAQEFDGSAPVESKIVVAAQEAEIAELRRQLDESQRRHANLAHGLSEARRQLELLSAAPCEACEAAQAEAAALRTQLQQAQAAKSEDDDARLQSAIAERDELGAKLAAAARDLELLHGECDARQTALESAQMELAQLDAARQDVAAQLAAEKAATAEFQRLAERLQKELASAQQAGEDAQKRIAQAERLAAERETALSEAAATYEARLRAMEEASTAADRGSVELRNQLAVADKLCGDLRRQLSESDAKIVEFERQSHAQSGQQRDAEETIADLRRKLAVAEQLAAAGESLPEATRQIEANQQTISEQATTIAQLERRLAETEASFSAERGNLAPRTELEQAYRERDEAQTIADQLSGVVEESTAALSRAEQRIHELTEQLSVQPAVELLQQKFELALTDVQKLKRENATLREELASRPEPDERDTSELVTLRAEREQLVARVADLENAPQVASDSELQTQLEELQRRFEMAVDDVRHLKRENAELRDKASHAPAAARPAAGGAMDWAAQKAQLLASLAEEDDASLDAHRRKERLAIEQTIAATDQVVAGKNQEIEALRGQLQSAIASSEGSDAAHRRAETAKLLDADELIVAERANIEQLRGEWEEKIRKAELEFSVERAKLAREQAVLKEKLVELEMSAPRTGGDSQSKPRKRWIDALGLRDEEGPSKS